MILDSKGQPIKTKRRVANDGSCTKCGAPKEKMHPVLGGMIVCMACGEQRKEEVRGNGKTAGSRGAALP